MAEGTRFARERWKRWLAWLGLRLGSKVSVQRPAEWKSEPMCRLGQIAVCSACSKVVGVFSGLTASPLDPTVQLAGGNAAPVFLDAHAGLVLERRYQILKGAIFCGRDGCDTSRSYEHPIACSDECESRILFDPRFEQCDPGEDYKRFSAGLEASGG